MDTLKANISSVITQLLKSQISDKKEIDCTKSINYLGLHYYINFSNQLPFHKKSFPLDAVFGKNKTGSINSLNNLKLL